MSNKRVIGIEEFNSLVGKICDQVQASEWKPDYIVGLSRGGLIPAVMMSHRLDVPMRALEVSLRDGGMCVSDLGMGEDAYEGRNILVVDDINDTGATINWIVEDWPSGCFPDDERWPKVWNNNVRFAVIVNNEASEADVKVDYHGLFINKDVDPAWIQFPFEAWW